MLIAASLCLYVSVPLSLSLSQPVTLEQASKAIDSHLATSHMEVSLVGDFDIEEVRCVVCGVMCWPTMFLGGEVSGHSRAVATLT